MDLSPIYLDEFEFNGLKIRPNKKIRLTPYLGDKNYIRIEYEPWALCVFAKDRTTLLKNLIEQLYVLWVEFAEELDSKLGKHSLKIKQRLLEDFSAFKSSDPVID